MNKVVNLAEAYINLNNAYYLGRYFALSDELNKSYPLNHFTFRGGFNAWEHWKIKASIQRSSGFTLMQGCIPLERYSPFRNFFNPTSRS